jgi:Fe-S-cluster containining protein
MHGRREGTTMSKMDAVVPTKLTLDTKFRFRCHKGLQCFTKCCSNIDILLTPYDILTLKKRMGLSSGEFLSHYTYVKIDEKSSHPFVMLKMLDDKEKKCPFVTSEGCTIYSDRPANCRYYPIGQGTLKKEGKNGPGEEEFYFFVQEPHCLGYREKKEWTIRSWRLDQEVDVYDEHNREWKALQMRKNIPGQGELDHRKQAMFYTASYDIDNFKRFIFESTFLNTFDVDDKTLDNIKNDEQELMKFGFQYIKYFMMLEKTLKVKDGILEARRKKH